MAESPQNLYAKNLRQSFGYPLRFPEPRPGLPPSYAEDGLHIGDVGCVNDDGLFDVRFNICFSRDHDLHRDKDLSGLVGLARFKPNEVPSISNAFSSGRVICHGIHGSHGDSLKHPQRFLSCSPSGAILILPSGAIRQNLAVDKEEEFRKLAEKHALEWCQFAGCKSLYLITGFYKTNSWYLGSFQDVGPDKQVLLERDEVGRYTWDSRCDYRQSVESLDENQTVLISGFKMEVRGWDKHTHAFVEKLSPHPRSILSELRLLANSMLGIFLFFWKQVVSRRVFKLPDHTLEDIDAGIHINHVPALSRPFHPSDIINRYLLDKNLDVPVAITHDRQWLGMLERNELSHENMVDEERFRAFLGKNYADDPNSDNVVYLRRRTSMVSLKAFSFPTAPDDIRQIAITRIRVENVVHCLGRIPVGFYTIVQYNGEKRRSKHKPALFYNGIIEWDDEIMLPTDSSVKVQISINASFEFEPMLGNGEMLRILETSVGSLSRFGSTHFPRREDDTSPSLSILITCEERRLNHFAMLNHDSRNLRCGDRSCDQVVEQTDKGHDALLHYLAGQGTVKLEECNESFKHALDLCPVDYDGYAAALFNYATVSFINSQLRGRISDLDVAIASYRKALALRPDQHPDRPATLLHLSQALLYYYGKLRAKTSIADEIEGLTAEIKQICSQSGHYYRAAILAVQTLKRYRVLKSRELTKLDELVLELDLSTRMPPDWYFDRPNRLLNFAAALHKRFEITGDFNDLERSISAMETATQLILDSHLDKPWMFASLGDALCARFIRCGHITDLESAISMIEDSVKLTPDGHFDKPWMLASLGDALRVRFVRHGDIADLESSISMIEEAVKLALNNHFCEPWILASLGGVLRDRFLHRGNITDLTSSISMIEDAMKYISDSSHNDKPWMLASLGDTLHIRFLQRGDVTDSDLEHSISMIQNAMALAQDGHPKKPRVLASLSDALRVRFTRGGNIADLEGSICMIEEAVKLVPDGHSDKPRMMTSFGDALRVRFVQRGDVTDLDNSLSMIKNAVARVPDGHSDKPWMLAVLGGALRARFIQRGYIADLAGSISIIEDAVKLTPNGYFYKPWMLASLSDILRLRFVQRGDMADLESSIFMIEEAIKLGPNIHFHEPWILASHGDVLRVRFLHRSNIADLLSSISMLEDAVKYTPDGHVDKPWMLTSLANALVVRFAHGNMSVFAGLNNSISMIEEAVQLVSHSHFDKPWMLASLGSALRVRFVHHGDAVDLDNSISMMEQAVNLAPNGHVDKLWMLASLSDALRARFVNRGEVADLESSISTIEVAVKLTVGPLH